MNILANVLTLNN